MTVVGVERLLELLQQRLVEARGEEEGPEEQVWAVEQVLAAVRNPRLTRRGPWMLSAANLLLGHAFFSLTTPTESIVSHCLVTMLCLSICVLASVPFDPYGHAPGTVCPGELPAAIREHPRRPFQHVPSPPGGGGGRGRG